MLWTMTVQSPDQIRQAENERLKAVRNNARTQRRTDHVVTFIGVDGEGTGNGRNHKYVLLGVGSEQIENSNGQQFTEIATFLYGQYLKHPNAAFVGFYLGYDFSQWLKTLPENRARMLLTEAGRAKRKRVRSGKNTTPFPMRYSGWEVDVIGSKCLKLRPEGKTGWMYINDAGPFYQTSFINTINPANWDKPIVTDEEYATILKGKGKRETAKLDEDMKLYNRLENEVLSRLMTRLNEGFMDAGIRLRKDQWFGPGQAAQEWMRFIGMPTREQIEAATPWPVLRDALATYYGGWFEIFMHGIVPGKSYEYDINSAYPSIASKLPCLLHGKWEHRNRAGETKVKRAGKLPADIDSANSKRQHARNRMTPVPVSELPVLAGSQIRLMYASVTGSDSHIGTMLHRSRFDHLSITRPDRTTGWFWQHELDAAQRAGLIDSLEILEWWTYTPCECRPPLRGLAGLYDKRLRVSKNSSAGKSYKLIYNSIYGKLAQSVGEPKYANIIYASLITAGCRTMILDAIRTHPEGTKAVAMVATDGVYFTSPHPGLSLSEKLGEWECKEHVNLTLFKPGVYWDDNARESIDSGKAPKFKARGVNANAFSECIAKIDEMFKAWDGTYPQSVNDWPEIEFPIGFSMVTCLQALQWNKWFLAGMVSDDKENVQRSRPDEPKTGKRGTGYYDGTVYRSTPCKLPVYSDGKWDRSAPYAKGMSVEETHSDPYYTPDGSIGLILAETLGMKG